MSLLWLTVEGGVLVVNLYLKEIEVGYVEPAIKKSIGETLNIYKRCT